MDVRVGLWRRLNAGDWCFWTVVLGKTLETPLDYKEIQPIHSKGNQCWIFIGRTDVEAETLILWPPDTKSWFIGKYPDAGKDLGQEEKGMTEDEMTGWHHQWAWVWVNSGSWWWTGRPGVLRGCKELDMTEQLNWTEPPHEAWEREPKGETERPDSDDVIWPLKPAVPWVRPTPDPSVA